MIRRDENWLVRQARAGDAAAFGELARCHTAAALRVATVVLGTSEGADDVVQLALERAWRAMQKYDPERSFVPWLLRIVANCARNDRRSRGRRARLMLRVATAGDGDGGVTPEDRAVDEADRREVVNALNRLRAEDRLVIALRYFERLGEAEMAEVMDCPPGTVKSRLSRARSRLKSELVRHDREELAHD